jgi:hypothetical protein
MNEPMHLVPRKIINDVIDLIYKNWQLYDNVLLRNIHDALAEIASKPPANVAEKLKT